MTPEKNERQLGARWTWFLPRPPSHPLLSLPSSTCHQMKKTMTSSPAAIRAQKQARLQAEITTRRLALASQLGLAPPSTATEKRHVDEKAKVLVEEHIRSAGALSLLTAAPRHTDWSSLSPRCISVLHDYNETKDACMSLIQRVSLAGTVIAKKDPISPASLEPVRHWDRQDSQRGQRRTGAGGRGLSRSWIASPGTARGQRAECMRCTASMKDSL